MKIPEQYKTKFKESMRPTTIAFVLLLLFGFIGLFMDEGIKMISTGMLISVAVIFATAFSEEH